VSTDFLEVVPYLVRDVRTECLYSPT